MNKLTAIFTAVALLLSGGVLANTADGTEASRSPAPSAGKPLPDAGAESPGDPQATTPEPSEKPVEGFVLLQRNVYVPIDADGKITSNEWVVVDRHGFVTAEELKTAQAENGKEDDGSSGKGDDANAEASPRGEAGPTPSPRSTPSGKDHPLLGSGPAITS